MPDQDGPAMDHGPVLFHTTPVVLFTSSHDASLMYPVWCCLLVLMAGGLRFMMVFKSYMDKRGWGTRWDNGRDAKLTNGSWVRVNDDRIDEMELAEHNAGLGPSTNGFWTTPPVVGGHNVLTVRGFSLFLVERFIRATVETSMIFLGYVLMLVVMTMNIGYILSILLGVFLSTFIIGDRLNR